MGWFSTDRARYVDLATSWVAPEPGRCVQCGICTFNCPMGLDVRAHAWLVEPVGDGGCLTCGECARRCPRGLLRFERIGTEGAGARQPAAGPRARAAARRAPVAKAAGTS